VPTSLYHVSTDAAAVVIGTGTIGSTGKTLATGNVFSVGFSSSFTVMDENITVTGTTFVQMVAFKMYLQTDDYASVKLLHIRLNSGTYEVIDSTEYVDFYMRDSSDTYYMYCGFNMDSSDTIAITITKPYSNTMYICSYTGGSGNIMYKSSGISGDTLRTDWTEYNNYNLSSRLFYFV